MQTAFELLSFKEREILGSFFGVYGHKKETLAEIGEVFQMRESAASKAKDKALEKLRKLCMESEFSRWRSIRTAIRAAQRDCVVGRGDLGRYLAPDRCEEIE